MTRELRMLVTLHCWSRDGKIMISSGMIPED